MRYDTKIDYYDGDKKYQDFFIGAVADLGAQKENDLFGDMKEQRIHIQAEESLPIRSGFFSCKYGKFKITKASLDQKNFYCGEYDGKL